MQKPGARGESMVIDLTFAVFIFLLVVWSLTSVWSNKAAESERQIYEDETLLLAERALGTLITSSGQPQDWETKPFADVNVIGLAKSDRVLDGEKINRVIELVSGEQLPELAGFWKFDGGGTTIVDSSGNDNEGNIDGATRLEGSLCKVFGCLSFDGSDEVNVGNRPGLQITGDMTIMFWVYPTNVGPTRQNPMDKAYGGEFALTMEDSPDDGDLSYYHGSAGGETSPYMSCVWQNVFEQDKWVHIALVRNASARTMRLYKNSQSQAPCSWGSDRDPSASSENVTIGRGYAGAFFGSLDEVAIFNEALSGEEVQKYYENGIMLAEYEAVKQKLLIGANDYYFRLIDPSTGEAVKNSEGQFIKIGKKPTNGWLQTTIKRPVVFAYERKGEGEAKEHEAIAELTLFLPYRTW